MGVLLFFALVGTLWRTVHYLLKLQKLKMSKEEWGYLTDEEETKKENDTARAAIWGIVYVGMLFAFMIYASTTM